MATEITYDKGVGASDKKTRKSPVPANAERITEGALKLPLAQRVELKNKLGKSIMEELDKMEADFKEAKELMK